MTQSPFIPFYKIERWRPSTLCSNALLLNGTVPTLLLTWRLRKKAVNNGRNGGGLWRACVPHISSTSSPVNLALTSLFAESDSCRWSRLAAAPCRSKTSEPRKSVQNGLIDLRLVCLLSPLKSMSSYWQHSTRRSMGICLDTGKTKKSAL